MNSLSNKASTNSSKTGLRDPLRVKLYGTILLVILLFFYYCVDKRNTISSEHDKTVSIDTLYTMTPEDTEYTYFSGTALRSKIFSGPTDLAEESELIVLATAGTPKSFLLDPSESYISNITDYTIQHVFRGNLQVDDVISVYEEGGLMPYEIYYEATLDPNDEGISEFDESAVGKMISTAFTDGDLPKEGEQYVLFLRDASDFVPGSYTTVGGYTGRYIKNDFGVFSRYEPEPGFYPSTTERMALYPEQTFANEMFGEQNPNFTFEEFQLLLK